MLRAIPVSDFQETSRPQEEILKGSSAYDVCAQLVILPHYALYCDRAGTSLEGVFVADSGFCADQQRWTETKTSTICLFL
eukprot:2802978-Amphidinium_carterae.1